MTSSCAVGRHWTINATCQLQQQLELARLGWARSLLRRHTAARTQCSDLTQHLHRTLCDILVCFTSRTNAKLRHAFVEPDQCYCSCLAAKSLAHRSHRRREARHVATSRARVVRSRLQCVPQYSMRVHSISHHTTSSTAKDQKVARRQPTAHGNQPVSYTHLTLPTIYSV